MTYEDTEEQPLDPVMERVRKKMIRLMVISIGIMMVGILAVLFAIVYKINNPETDGETRSARAPGDPVEINLGLPVSTEVLSTAVHGNRLVLDVKTANGARQLILFDADTGQLISRININ